MPIAKRIQHNDWHDFPMDHFLIFVGLWSCDDSHQTNNTHSRHTPNNIPRRLRRHGDIYFHRRYPLRLWWVHSDHTGWRNNGDRRDIPARVCTLSCHRRATGVASTIVHRAHMPCTNNTWLVSVMAFGSSEAATPHRGDLFLDRRWNKILFHFEFEREKGFWFCEKNYIQYLVWKTIGHPSVRNIPIGNANGLPKHHMIWATYSMHGLTVSRQSATTPKHWLQPHPSFQQSQQLSPIQLLAISMIYTMYDIWYMVEYVEFGLSFLKT